MKHSPTLLFLFFLLLLSSSCAHNAGRAVNDYAFEEEVAKMAAAMDRDETVAVSWVYDRSTGDITALGNIWRDRLESGLRKAGITVKARKDLGFLIDDISTFDPSGSESEIWEVSGADVIIVGDYSINNSNGRIALRIKALRKNTSIAGTLSWSENLPHNWPRLAARIKGNVYHKEISSITASADDQPTLTASLNRTPACYPSGSKASIQISTDPGVHIYILNLAADNTVSLLYPNSRMGDQPLPTGRFLFPPRALARDLQLLLYPLKAGLTSQESFKIVASRKPLDFSFLPVPDNEIFSGIRGGDRKKVLDMLKRSRHWNEINLNYWIGPDCEN